MQQELSAGSGVPSTSASASASQKKPGRFWAGLNLFLCAAIAGMSYRYLFGVGPVPPLVAQNLFKQPWLVLHAVSAATALLVSPLQLLPSLRRRAALHRWLGRAYVLSCTVGGVTGVPLALGSAAGGVATAGFGLLAIAWLVTTLSGWVAGLRRQVVAHRVWMIRSFSLTYAAVTLRIYLAVLPLLPVAAVSGYRAVAFLCWVPNLIVAELLLRRGQPVRASGVSAERSLA